MDKKFIVLIIVILLIAVVYIIVGDLKKTKEIEVVKESAIEEAEEDIDSTINYFNSHYNFSVDVPIGLKYCLNDFCDDSAQDKDVNFKITAYNFLEYQNIEITEEISTYPYLEIRPRKNLLGMSAIDFAKRSLDFNRKYSKNFKDTYSQEEKIVFAGEDAYSFIAEKGFEERGALVDDEGAKDSPKFYETVGEGTLLELPHKIIYLDHDGIMYRIIYPIENEIAVDIIDSFKFIEPTE